MFFTYNARRSYFDKMSAPDGAASGSAGSGTGVSGSNGDSSGSSGDNSGDAQTGGTGSDKPESGTKDGDQSDGSKTIHGMPVELWNSLPKASQEAIKDVAKFRRELRDKEQKLAQYEGKDQSAEEKLAQERAALEAEKAQIAATRRQYNITEAFTSSGKLLGAKAPELLALIAPSVADIELDEADKPKNTDALIKAIRNKYPFLFDSTDANGGAGNGQAANVDTSALFAGSRLAYAYAERSGKKDRK